jgi:hypothetical protein
MPTLDVDSKLEPAAILEAAERLRPPPLQDGDVARLSTPSPRPPIHLVWGWNLYWRPAFWWQDIILACELTTTCCGSSAGV